MLFSFPDYLESSVISELENHIIDICNSCTSLEDLLSATSPVWEWAGRILNKPLDELRSEIESHETDEQFPDQYLEEKDHLLKLPLLLLQEVNSKNF
jgi:hypothetical protein